MTNSFRTPGVLGGMGPEATIDFMARVLALTPAGTDQEHIRLLVDQNPRVPNRQAALLDDAPSPGPVLAAMAKGLQEQGADFLVMPCNSAHAYQSDIEAAVDIPFVSIVEATIAGLADGARPGLLSTRGCLDAGLYQAAFADAEIECVLTSDEQADDLTRLAFAIKAGDHGDAVSDAVRAHALGLIQRGATAVIAACTELPLVLRQADFDVPLLSSTEELARKTVAIATGEEALPAH